MSIRTVFTRSTPPDFGRDVHCVFGLPFDAIDEGHALLRIRASVELNSRMLLSTPNLSFAAGCMADDVFRLSVVNSDLSTPDGVSIVSLARLMGAPLTERVTGSTVFERLVDEPGPEVSVYFFGGEPGAAERAAERLNEAGRPWIRVVGHCSPGFGTVEEMSGPAFTDPINAAKPDFVVVALGARKGQQWIGRNWPALRAPVISHLGAVLNFTAGTIRRAPVWIQRQGLEWLWRIKEEPSLWRRYWNDGWTLLRFVVTQALPWALFNRGPRPHEPVAPLAVEAELKGEVCVLRLQGSADNGPGLAVLRAALAEACAHNRHVSLDLSGVRRVGTAFIALVQLLDGWQRPRTSRSVLTEVPRPVARAFSWAGAAYVLTPDPQVQPVSAAPARHANT